MSKWGMEMRDWGIAGSGWEEDESGDGWGVMETLFYLRFMGRRVVL